MAIGVDTTGANSAAGATVTITPAATVADGSMIYVVINAIHSSNDPPTGYTVPSGFTQIGSDVETEYGNTSVWRRTAGASEASSYTFTQTGGGDYSTSGALVALTGVDTSTPNGTIVSLSDTTSNTTFEIPALTTDTDNSWDVAFVGGGGALGETKTLSTWGDSLVEQADGGGDYGVAGIGAVLRATAGAQAATECVSSSADLSHAFRLEVYAAAGLSITVPRGEIAFTGIVSTVAQTAHHVIVPSKGDVAFTGFSPDAVTDQAITPSKGLITFDSTAPTIAQTAHKSVAPSNGSIVFTGRTASIAQTARHAISPSKGTVVFNSTAPTVSTTAAGEVSPSKGSIAFTGFAATVTQTANQFATPSHVTVDFTGFAPTVENAVTTAPSKGTIAFTGFTATVAVTTNHSRLPTAGAISFTGFAPTVTGGIAAEVATAVIRGGVRHRRKLLKLPDGRITYADDNEIRKLLQFYKVSQASLEATFEEKPTRRQLRRIKNKAIPAPLIIEEMEEEEDLQFIIKEIAKSLR